jgi:hypothetical protein
MTEPTKKEILAEAYRGVSNARVELSDSDSLSIKIDLPGTNPPSEPASHGVAEPLPAPEEAEPAAEMMSISLDNISLEVNNQSYGMITASTGCASNIGGPSC